MCIIKSSFVDFIRFIKTDPDISVTEWPSHDQSPIQIDHYQDSNFKVRPYTLLQNRINVRKVRSLAIHIIQAIQI